MVIGTVFLGKVKEMNGQWIETKFFILGLPLFPTSSMLVTAAKHGSRQGMSIPLNATSIIAGYARLFTFIAAFILLALGLMGNAGPGSAGVLITVALALAALWAFFYFSFGKPTTEEMEQRNRLGNATGIYAMPHWFSFDDALANLKNYEYHYYQTFPNSNWKTDANNQIIPADKKALLYQIALFNFIIDSSAENEALLEKVEKSK